MRTVCSPFGIGGERDFYDDSVSYWFPSIEGKASRLGGRRLMDEYCCCLKQQSRISKEPVVFKSVSASPHRV